MSIPNCKEDFFVISHTHSPKSCYRRGLLMSELNTPCCPFVCEMLVPDVLTTDYLSEIQQKLFLCISYSSLLPCLPMIEEYEKESKNDSTLIPFVDYKNAITLVTFRNLLVDNIKIENHEFAYFVDSEKYFLTEDTSRKILNLIKPSMSIIPFEILNLVDRSKWSSKKRERAQMKYNSFVETLKDCSNYTHLVQTVHDVIDREPDLDFTALDFCGFGYGESLADRQEALSRMIRENKEEKLRIFQLKTGTPLEVLQAVLLGIDVVVSPYPQILSKAGRALYFNFPSTSDSDLDLESVLNLLDDNCKFVDGVYKDTTNNYLDLKDSVYSDQVNVRIHHESIRKESRGYVNHLLGCNEMTGYMILSAHNTWMYEMLFRKIRDSIENDTLVGFVHNFVLSNLE